MEEWYYLFFSYIENFSSAYMGVLLDCFGCATGAYSANEKELWLLADNGIPADYVHRIIERRRGYEPEKEYAELAQKGIGYVSMNNNMYPERLHHIADKPVGLFYRGKLPDGNTPAVAIVGSRGCSAYGKEMAISFAKKLAEAGVDIISGMASGVDGYAHRGALNAGAVHSAGTVRVENAVAGLTYDGGAAGTACGARCDTVQGGTVSNARIGRTGSSDVPGNEHCAASGETFAVLGCGVDICYPQLNKDIYNRIPERGGILSEYPPGTIPMPFNFPRRNRIISGLSDGILVVEAREKSGTWITVDMGLDQGKDIYAIPGRIGDALSIGCNRLIRRGAQLVMSADDIIAELAPRYGYLVNRTGCGDAKMGERRENSGLSASERLVYDSLDYTAKSIDEIQNKTGLDAATVIATLTFLELKGLCVTAGVGKYSKKNLAT